MDRTRVDRGFTLVEVMITMVILGAAMAAAVVGLNTATIETALGTADAMVQDATNRFAERLVTELRSASKSSIVIVIGRDDLVTDYGSTGGDGIKFRVPVDPDGDGSVIDPATGKPDYGATLGGLQGKDWSIVYRFVSLGPRMKEAEVGVDLNVDMDTVDEFDRGYFERVVVDSGLNAVRPPRRIGARWYLHGDGDNDGIAEPIFLRQLDGTIRIDLWAVQLVGRNNAPARAHVITSVLPYNQ